MDNQQRLANYQAQNARDGRKHLTHAQHRQLRKHNPDRAFKQRWDRRVPREELIDNQHLPTGRVGWKRFGPRLGLAGLQQAFFPVRKSEKGRDVGQAAYQSQLGRSQVRTAHNRRKGARARG